MAVHDLEYFQYNYTVWHAFFKKLLFISLIYTCVAQTSFSLLHITESMTSLTYAS